MASSYRGMHVKPKHEPGPEASKMPDANGRHRRRFVDIHPISKVSLGQVVGLVEAVDEAGGDADVALIARESEMGLDQIAPVIAAAEFLGLILVDDGNLRLTDLSRRVLQASVRERKSIFREIMGKTPVFSQVMEAVRGAGRPLTRKEVLEALTVTIGSHQVEDVFRALIYWGRYVELVSYDSRTEQLSLRTPPLGE
jgi:NitT/TauT family transport system ATP-binding protein